MANVSRQSPDTIEPGWPPPQIARLTGGRLHLQHGPIDLVIKAAGAPDVVQRAEAAAMSCFRGLLDDLVRELPVLRGGLSGLRPPCMTGPVARRMVAACWPHRGVFITPMAAVAGSVADEVRDMMMAAAPDLRTLYVNNGGDIGLHVGAGENLAIGIVPDLARAIPDGVIALPAGSGIGGVATSGWRGRSFSLGIADAVTVLAASAAEADAAATMIANAVSVDDPAVTRRPARQLDPDSDLGDLAVTIDVRHLLPDAVASALDAGAAEARRLRSNGLILGAMLALQQDFRIVS